MCFMFGCVLIVFERKLSKGTWAGARQKWPEWCLSQWGAVGTLAYVAGRVTCLRKLYTQDARVIKVEYWVLNEIEQVFTVFLPQAFWIIQGSHPNSFPRPGRVSCQEYFFSLKLNRLGLSGSIYGILRACNLRFVTMNSLLWSSSALKRLCFGRNSEKKSICVLLRSLRFLSMKLIFMYCIC